MTKRGFPEVMITRNCIVCGERVGTPCRMEKGKFYHFECWHKRNDSHNDDIGDYMAAD